MSIWSLKKEGPLCYKYYFHLLIDNLDVIKDSGKAITKLKWFEKDRLLFTGSKEKNIKVSFFLDKKIFLNFFKIWEFPEVWRDPKVEEEEEFDEKVRRKTSAMIDFKKKQEKLADDSDEDGIDKIRF